MGIEINGERHDLIPFVAAYIERGGGHEPLLEETTEGRFIEVPATVLRTVADVLMELGTPAGTDSKVRLSRTRALALDSLEHALGDHGVAPGVVRHLRNNCVNWRPSIQALLLM